MSLIDIVLRALSRERASAYPRIVVFGDSHVHAVQEAIRRRKLKGRDVRVEAYRLFKVKNNTAIGSTSFSEFLKLARWLRPYDVLISLIGGNQHAVFGTIQHPQRFDFFIPGDSDYIFEEGLEIIPYCQLYEFFLGAIREGDGKSIAALRKTTRAQMFHMIAPPPKFDSSFIQQFHDTRFAADDIAALGVSPPALRMKFWRLQNLALDEFCSELSIPLILSPDAAHDEQGFLARELYANDATHANAAYGELLIQSLESRFTRASEAMEAGS